MQYMEHNINANSTQVLALFIAVFLLIITIPTAVITWMDHEETRYE